MSVEGVKQCSKCGESKPLDAFYANVNGTHGRMPYCKKCDNARPRKASALKINRIRARHRAVADLIAMHAETFETLLAIRLAEAKDEAEELAATPEAAEHYQDSEPVRLRPGKRMQGEKVGDRIDVARCSHCVKHHDRGHVCTECGAAPSHGVKRQVSPRNKNLVSSFEKRSTPIGSIPSGVRPRTDGIDAAALEEFNRGTQRAAGVRS